MFAGQPDGARLGEELGSSHPLLRILYMSGYAKGSLHLTPENRFLPKPFTFDQLKAELDRVFSVDNSIIGHR